MVGGSISFHTIAHLAMRYHKKRYEVTPQILHDRDTTKPLRQSRHNKSILSQNSVFQFLFLPAARLVNMYCWSRGPGGTGTFSFLETSVHVKPLENLWASNFGENFGKFENFWKIWKFLENLKIFGKFEKFWKIWKFLENLKIFGKFENFWKNWKTFEKLKIFGKFEKFEKYCKISKILIFFKFWNFFQILKFFFKFWIFFEILKKFEKFEIFWNFWQFFSKFWMDYQAGSIGQPGWPIRSSGDLGSVAPGPLSQTASTGRLR